MTYQSTIDAQPYDQSWKAEPRRDKREVPPKWRQFARDMWSEGVLVGFH